MNKTKPLEDKPAGDYEILEKALKNSQRWAAIGFSSSAVLAVGLVLLAISVFYLKETKVVSSISYLSADGQVITEPLAESIPTINQSVDFISSCIKRSLQLRSASFRNEVNRVRYCYADDSFSEYRSIMAGMIQNNFLSSNIDGGYEVDDVKVEFSHDTNTKRKNAVGCSANYVRQFRGAESCRVYLVDVSYRAINYANGRESKLRQKGRIDVLIGARSSISNGQKIIWIDLPAVNAKG